MSSRFGPKAPTTYVGRLEVALRGLMDEVLEVVDNLDRTDRKTIGGATRSRSILDDLGPRIRYGYYNKMLNSRPSSEPAAKPSSSSSSATTGETTE